MDALGLERREQKTSGDEMLRGGVVQFLGYGASLLLLNG